jgi:predicted metal-dependent hydrolase
LSIWGVDEPTYLSPGLPGAFTFSGSQPDCRAKAGRGAGKTLPGTHDFATDKALWQYTQDLKNRYLKSAPPINKVMYDNKIHVLKNALGLHTAISRVQGGKLKAKAEIRVATVFRNAPEAFLRMIVVHELAHLKEKEHDKAFYSLCCHMEPQYHQLEFDTRLWLTHLSLKVMRNSARELS